MRPEGVEIGGLINRSNSESTTFTAARLNVDGDLDVDVGRDLGLFGARVHTGGDADIDVANNLTIKTLQDISESSNFSAGLSVTVGPSGPTGGSANFAAGNSESQRSLDGLASLTAGGALDADVGGTTEVTGGIIGSESDQLDLTTTSLVLNDLTERERSRQVSLNASFNNSGPPVSGTPAPINSADSGGSEFNVGGFGGSFSSAALDGTTRATIGQGNVTVTSQSEDETAAQLAGTNRDINNATTITRDTSFDTGNIFIDVGSARRAKGNKDKVRKLSRAFNFDDKYRQQLLDIYGSENLIPEMLLKGLKNNDFMLILSDEQLSQLSLECDININGCVKTNGGVVLLEGNWASPDEIIALQNMVEGVLPAVLQAHTIIKKYQNNEFLSIEEKQALVLFSVNNELLPKESFTDLRADLVDAYNETANFINAGLPKNLAIGIIDDYLTEDGNGTAVHIRNDDGSSEIHFVRPYIFESLTGPRTLDNQLKRGFTIFHEIGLHRGANFSGGEFERTFHSNPFHRMQSTLSVIHFLQFVNKNLVDHNFKFQD